MICTCEKCKYIFEAPVLPASCPDCGHNSVRAATDLEIIQHDLDRENVMKETEFTTLLLENEYR